MFFFKKLERNSFFSSYLQKVVQHHVCFVFSTNSLFSSSFCWKFSSSCTLRLLPIYILICLFYHLCLPVFFGLKLGPSFSSKSILCSNSLVGFFSVSHTKYFKIKYLHYFQLCFDSFAGFLYPFIQFAAPDQNLSALMKLITRSSLRATRELSFTLKHLVLLYLGTYTHLAQ